MHDLCDTHTHTHIPSLSFVGLPLASFPRMVSHAAPAFVFFLSLSLSLSLSLARAGQTQQAVHAPLRTLKSRCHLALTAVVKPCVPTRQLIMLGRTYMLGALCPPLSACTRPQATVLGCHAPCESVHALNQMKMWGCVSRPGRLPHGEPVQERGVGPPGGPHQRSQ